tara:strand:- start:1358 stop:1756 length:399 start_codon:yes stop_codon:yes gene_type:complete
MNSNLTLDDYVFSQEGQHLVLEFNIYPDTLNESGGPVQSTHVHMSGTNPGMTEEEQVRYALDLARSGYYHLHLKPKAKAGKMESVGLFIVRPWDTSEVDSIVAEWFRVKFKYCWPIKCENLKDGSYMTIGGE